MVYILPEGLFSNTEYRHIREYLATKSTMLSATLFSERVFEAAVDAAVVLFKKDKVNLPLKIYRDLDILVAELLQSDLQIAPNYIFPVMVDSVRKDIIAKLEKNVQKKFSDLLEVQQGIIYSGKPKEEVFSNTKLSDQYKEVLDGRDILKYKINWSAKLENRYIKYTKDLHRPREERIFLAKEKIVLPRRSARLVCAFDSEQYYLLNTAYTVLPKTSDIDLRYILGILNSKLIDFYYQSLYFGWQITIPALNSLPIAIGTEKQQKEIIKIVESILSQAASGKDYSGLQASLDAAIYELYGLDSIQVSTIEEILSKI
jgi:hypothetical protein